MLAVVVGIARSIPRQSHGALTGSGRLRKELPGAGGHSAARGSDRGGCCGEAGPLGSVEIAGLCRDPVGGVAQGGSGEGFIEDDRAAGQGHIGAVARSHSDDEGGQQHCDHAHSDDGGRHQLSR